MVPDSMLAAISVTQRQEVWRRILCEPPGPTSTSVYVAAAGARLTGFSSCGRQRSDELGALGYGFEISAIYVLRSFQGIGIGGALFEAMRREFRKMDDGNFSLWVLRDNSRARGFYEHLGGRVVGARQDARAEGVLHELAYGWRNSPI